MKYDEIAFRQLESLILADLVKSGASSRLLKIAHCLDVRLISLPNVQTVEGKLDKRALFGALLGVTEQMKNLISRSARR